MHKKIGKILIIGIAIFMIFILSGFTLYYKFGYRPIKTIYYKEGTGDFMNPDRGFYIQINTSEVERLAELKSENINIVLAAYDIKEYLNKPLDKEKLLELENFLREASKLHIKVIFRGAYDFFGSYKDPDSMDTILSHIQQISEVLNSYKGAILCVQAGFLGPWGEWHSSLYLEEGEKGIKNRNQVLKKLLTSLNKEIIINVRRPQFIRDAKNAGINVERLGIHNDAFLSTKDDMGTYSDPDYDRETELKWMEEWISTGINGGEMPIVSKYNNSSKAVMEMIKMKTSYLNRKYNEDILKKWESETYQGENSFEFIKGHLGYRLSLKKISMPVRLRNGHKLILEGVLQNTGFAPISSDYKFGLVVKKGGQIIDRPLNTFSISNLKHGESDKFQFEMELPKDFVLEDEMKIGIYIRKSSKLGEEPYLSYVKLANDEMAYEENVNYFVTYKKVDKKNQTSDKKSDSIKNSVTTFLKKIAADSVYYERIQ